MTTLMRKGDKWKNPLNGKLIKNANLLNDRQFLWCTIKQRIESITFTTHTNIIVLWGDLFLIFPLRMNRQECKKNLILDRMESLPMFTYCALNTWPFFCAMTIVTKTFSGRRIGARKWRTNATRRCSMATMFFEWTLSTLHFGILWWNPRTYQCKIIRSERRENFKKMRTLRSLCFLSDHSSS